MANRLPYRSTLPALRRLALAIATTLAPVALAQQPPDPPAAPPTPSAPTLSAPTHPIDFDLAVFKLHDPRQPAPTVLLMPVGGDSLTVGNRPIHDLIRYAFAHTRGGSYRISGQPAWVDDDRYDIQAKVAPEDRAEWQSLNQVGQKIALQGFLIQYLKLKFHDDTEPHPYYALVVAKSGLKMKEAKKGEEYKLPSGRVIPPSSLIWTSGNDLLGHDIRMPRLADQLAGHADRGFLEQTGLTAGYDFQLHFNDAPNPYNPDGPGMSFLNLPPETATPSIFSAVKPLGLELVPIKAPGDGMVVEHIERPPEN
jgi:uncharacterized protein (TIGR03435 family)